MVDWDECDKNSIRLSCECELLRWFCNCKMLHNYQEGAAWPDCPSPPPDPLMAVARNASAVCAVKFNTLCAAITARDKPRKSFVDMHKILGTETCTNDNVICIAFNQAKCIYFKETNCSYTSTALHN